MRPRAAFWITLVALLGFAIPAFAQYNPSAGRSAPKLKLERKTRDADGVIRTHTVEVRPPADHWGNAAGNNHDLAIDGAFEGQTVAVLHFYTGEGFDFSLPKAALKEKGFSVYRWVNAPPSPEDLEKGLAKASQLWIISGSTRKLTDAHIAVIKKFFEAGHGVYIWGDNEPYYADANAVAEALFDTKMLGNLMGNQTIGLQKRIATTGLLPNHLLTTGLEHIFEGITIATIQPSPTLKPLIYGSEGNLVAAFHDQDGRRAILDGGFTRLYIKWDTAGTARYVKNAASWLVNAERFGDAVIADSIKKPAVPTTKVPSFATPPPVAPVVTPPAPTMSEADDSFLPSGKVALLLVAAIFACFVLLYLPRSPRA